MAQPTEEHFITIVTRGKRFRIIVDDNAVQKAAKLLAIEHAIFLHLVRLLHPVNDGTTPSTQTSRNLSGTVD